MPCSQLSFLVVEDHEFQRSVMVQLLKSLGAEAVHTASDGREALHVLRDTDFRIDIVITDLSMPGMDGMELVRHLSETGSQVSLILASGLEPPLLAAIANMALAYNVRLLGVMSKPPTSAKLLPLIAEHRAAPPSPGGDEANFPIDEIAASWTNNDFEPWFEPQVDLATGELCGMHAAPRWRHPERGLLAADAFMPSIRARGLTEDFAWLMLQKSAARCHRWRRRGLDAPVSVRLLFDAWANVSLATRVKAIVEAEELEPRHLILSLPEPVVNTDAPRTLENLARLRVDGFGLALDDFGTGSMAVDRLALVAFTHLRIRPEFVTSVDEDEAARAGLAVALEMATHMRLHTVADGITRKEEWKVLHEWGCEAGQGPLISGALEGDSVGEWVRRWQATHHLLH